MTKSRLDLVAPALICLLGTLAYWQGLYGGFIFDDFPNLVSDPDWKVTTLEPTQWRRAMALGISSDSGRPLAMLSFAINHYFTGLDPFWLKLTNLAFHLLNGMLVFFLCHQLTAVASRDTPRQGSHVAALLVALAWTLHPLQVSSVLYVVQRMEVGAHTGVLLALIFYLRARIKQQQGASAGPWFVLSALATLLGLGFKESAALVPGYALALEVTLLRFRTIGSQPSRWLIGLYATALAIAVAVYLFHILPPYLSPGAYGFRPFTLSERLIAQIHALTMYLGQMILPLPSKLLFYYDNFPIQHALASTLAKLGVLVGLLVLAALSLRRLPLFSLGVLWFFLAHALTSNVIPLELAFEHRNYFALLGVLLCVTQVLTILSSKASVGSRRMLGAALIAFLAFLTAIQASAWGEPLRLATSLASKNLDSHRASYAMGAELVRAAGSNPESPLLSLAQKEFEHASGLPNASPLPDQALVYVHAMRGEKTPPQVWDRFQSKLAARRAGPEHRGALRGVLDCRLAGNCLLEDEALFDTLLVALENNPDSAVIASLYANFAFNVLGDTDLAIRVARDCIRLAPSDLEYRANLARMLAVAQPNNPELPQLIDHIRTNDVYGRYTDELNRGFTPIYAQQ